MLCLAFPLQPPGRAGVPLAASRLGELDAVMVSTLVVQGRHDRFGVPPATAQRTVVEVAGDGGLKSDLHAVRAAARTWLAGWCRGQVGDCGLARKRTLHPVGAVGRTTYRGPVPSVEYRYELRRGEEVVATGHFSREQALEVGEHLVIGSRPGIVRSIEPFLGERELRLVVQLTREEV
jgi:hypothetical protein